MIATSRTAAEHGQSSYLPGTTHIFPRLIHGSSRQHDSASETAFWSVQPFLQGSPVWPTYKETHKPSHLQHL